MAGAEQLALKAALVRAIEASRKRIEGIDQQDQAALLDLFTQAAERIAGAINRAAGAGGVVQQHDLPALVAQISTTLSALRDAQEKMITQSIVDGAASGARVIVDVRGAAAAGTVAQESIAALPDAAAAATEVAQRVVHGAAEDGLTLSDRIWRNYRAVQQELVPALQRAIIEGASARQATRDALLRSAAADPALLNKIEMARSGALGAEARRILADPAAQAYANASRVMRTELDRANILAQREAVYNVAGVVGTRFMLSPAHPRFDICDLHARLNLYGLGPGVYPKGQSPLPAHPNTLSFELPVFEWEVDPLHRTQRDDPAAWLQGRSREEQLGVLQSADKVRALQQGLLQPGEFTLPWRVLKQKYQNQLVS